MMQQAPINADHLAPMPIMATHHRTMLGEQAVTIPTRLKDRRMHRPAADRLAFRPDLAIVYALERFVGIDDQAGDVAADMLKASRSTKQGTIYSKIRLQRFGNVDYR